MNFIWGRLNKKARNDASFRAFIIAFQAAVKRGHFASDGVVKPAP
jgi:hypothetical protein